MFEAREAPRTRRIDGIDTIARQNGPMGHIVDLLYRIVLAIGFRVARTAWRLTQPRHEGALVAILVGPSMLMLRQSYRPELSMPGGGVTPGEDPAVAASRELAEELDLCVAPAALRQVHVETGIWDGRRDTVTFFELDLPQCPALRLDNREVVAASLVPFDQLDAADLTPAVGAYVAWRRARRAAGAEPHEQRSAAVAARSSLLPLSR